MAKKVKYGPNDKYVYHKERFKKEKASNKGVYSYGFCSGFDLSSKREATQVFQSTFLGRVPKNVVHSYWLGVARGRKAKEYSRSHR